MAETKKLGDTIAGARVETRALYLIASPAPGSSASRNRVANREVDDRHLV
jgi:hypothetical protein